MIDERERLKATCVLPGVQAVLEMHGATVEHAMILASAIGKHVTNGAAKAEVAEAFHACESPAERQFLLGAFSEPERYLEADGKYLWCKHPISDELYLTYRVSPQFTLDREDWFCEECDDEDEGVECPHEAPIIARLDFELYVPSQSDEEGVFPSSTLYVEIDGHDYHERSKEQAQRDCERDRRVLRAGFWGAPVIRFTASEVYRNHSGCFAEAAATLWAVHSERRALVRTAQRLLLEDMTKPAAPPEAGAGAAAE